MNFLLILTSWWVLGTATPPATVVESELLFPPSTVLQVHASTLVETESGLVASWFGGTSEQNPDVVIWLTRQVDGDWTEPVVVASGAETEDPPVNCLNPVLFQTPAGGPLLLFYKTGSWWAYVKRSTDGGVTWSKAERLANSFYGPIKNKPVLLRDGSILSPSSTELAGPEGTAWKVHFERSLDGGNQWQRIGVLQDGLTIQSIQPSILIHGDGRLQALGRTRQGRLFEVWSPDDGRTWGRVELMDLPSNNSGTDAVTLNDGRHLLAYNHVTNTQGQSGGPRSPLNLAVSADGWRWGAALVLESEPDVEFSYPAIIQTRDGFVHLTYTWKRQSIKHVVIDPSRLRPRPIVDGRWPPDLGGSGAAGVD